MAYRDEIESLGADHLYVLESNSNDAIGTANGTDTTMAYTGTAIAEDASNAAVMNVRTDRVSLPSTTTINNSAKARKAVGGFFMVDSVELPFCRLYGEGNTTNFQILLQPGNTITVEARDGATWQMQAYSDFPLVADRPYHILARLESATYGAFVKLYVDGIEQSSSLGSVTDAALSATGVGEFGDPAGTVSLDGTTLLMQSPGDNRSTEQIINAYFNHWAIWGDTADAQLTDTEIREVLFGEGCLPQNTVASNTVGNMQTALDAITGTNVDEQLIIEIEAVTGGGDFTLDLDGQQFSDDASLHVRYAGAADTLTVRNINGANATKVLAPFGGSVILANEVDVTITVIDVATGLPVQNARVLLETNPGGVAIIDKVLTNASGQVTATFDWTANTAVTGTVRQGTSSTFYKTGTIAATITTNGLELTVQLVPDE